MPGSAPFERLRRVRDAREMSGAVAAAAAKSHAAPSAAPVEEPECTGSAEVRPGLKTAPGPESVSSAGAAPNFRGVADADAGSGSSVRASEPGEGPSLPIVDAHWPLDRMAPGTLVRDADRRVWIDLPDRRRPGGRRRIGVDLLLGMTGLGPHLVRAIFARWPARSVHTLAGEIAAAHHLVAPMTALGLSTVGPRYLPVDLFERIEGHMRAERGQSELPVRVRSAFNAVKRTMGRIGACAHVERRLDARIECDAADWTLTGDLPEPIAAGRWGDVETERLVKTCSEEILATVAGWNQLAGHLDDGVVGEGPLGPEELLLASAMLAIDPGFPAVWTELAKDAEVGKAMFELGKRAVREWSEREAAGELMGRTDRRTIAAWRGIEAGRMGYRRTGGRWIGCFGIMRAGWVVGVRAAYPTHRGMAPFATLLAIQGRLNAEVLMTLAEAEFGVGEADQAADAVGGEASAEVPERLRAAPWKGRSHRPYPIDFPVTLEPDDPAPIVEFVSLWTAGVRARGGSFAWAKFLYIGDLGRSGSVQSYAKRCDRAFPLALRQLCASAGVPAITPRELRRIGIDLVHDACDGDPETMRAAGNWRSLGTGERHYFGPSVVMRGQESLGWSIKIENRRMEKGIEVAGRPRGADLFSATDGFRCGMPLAGPDAKKPGELCSARGMCALCIHADVDVADPAWSLAQIAALADHIARRLEAGASPDWMARFAPVLDELLEFWLPFFPDDVVKEARRLPIIRYPELEL